MSTTRSWKLPTRGPLRVWTLRESAKTDLSQQVRETMVYLDNAATTRIEQVLKGGSPL
jgi:hypothetical protein